MLLLERKLLGLPQLFAMAVALISIDQVQGQSIAAPAASGNVQVSFVPTTARKSVPFDFARGLVLFKAKVQERDVWAVLDNGVERSAVDLQFARAIGLNVSAPSGEGRSPSGSVQLSEVEKVSIEIPGQATVATPVSAFDFSSLSRMFGVPVSLILGGDHFAHLAFFISPSERMFQLGPTGSLTPPPNSPVLILRNGKPQLEIAIEGKPALVTIDMGDNGTISLSQTAATRLELTGRPSVPTEASGAEGGRVGTLTTIVDKVMIGPAQSDHVPVTITPGILPGTADGRLGMGMLASTNFLLDVAAGRMWFVSPVGASSAEFQAAVTSAVRLYKAGAKGEAERQLQDLRGRAASPELLNSLCWAKAIARILLDSAIQDCTAAVNGSNGNASYLDSLGMVFLQSGKLAEAVAAYSRAIEKEQPASSYMGRAIAHSRMGDNARAKGDLAEAKKRDATVEKAYEAFGLKLATR